MAIKDETRSKIVAAIQHVLFNYPIERLENPETGFELSRILLIHRKLRDGAEYNIAFMPDVIRKVERDLNFVKQDYPKESQPLFEQLQKFRQLTDHVAVYLENYVRNRSLYEKLVEIKPQVEDSYYFKELIVIPREILDAQYE